MNFGALPDDEQALLRLEEDYDAMFGRGSFRRALGRWREDVERDQAAAVQAAERWLRAT